MMSNLVCKNNKFIFCSYNLYRNFSINRKDDIINFFSSISSVCKIKISKSGNKLVIASFKGLIHIWDIETLTLENILYTKLDFIQDIDFSENEKRILFGNEFEYKIYSLKYNHFLTTFSEKIQNLKFYKNLIVLSTTNEILLCTKRKKILKREKTKPYLFTVINNNFLGIVLKNGNIDILNLDTFTFVKKLKGDQNIKCLHFSKDNSLLVYISDNNTLKIIEINSESLIDSFEVENNVLSVNFSENRKILGLMYKEKFEKVNIELRWKIKHKISFINAVKNKQTSIYNFYNDKSCDFLNLFKLIFDYV